MTTIHDTLEALRESADARLAAAATIAELDEVEAATVGRGSPVATARRGLGQADPAERPALGRYINDVATEIAAKVAARRQELELAEANQRLAADRVDVTLPGRVPRRGTHHLITQTLEEMVDIFIGLGFDVATGPEIETAWHNFTALNIPETHPARAESDTLYVDWGEAEQTVLRTHTSPMQARYMMAHPPPVHVVVPGRAFRQDAVDATHSPVFHQMEGLAVDEGVNFAHLKGTLAHFAREFFGAGERVRFTPDHFPFTEPSAQMLVSCFACDGGGCRICSFVGWIEILGCGMVNPAVFRYVGYDPSQVTGWAFGIGVERVAAIRHGIGDLRHFFENDLRTLRQFV